MLHAVFTDGVGAITVQGLTQWDKGQELKITLSSLPATFQTHFSYKKCKTVHVVECTAENGVAVVPIPNIVLQQDTDAVAYVYVHEDETGETIKTVHLLIEPRARPADYVYEEIELVDYKVLKQESTNAIAVANQAATTAVAAANRAEAAALNAPKVENGTWWVYDAKQGAYVDTGVQASGAGSSGAAKIGSVELPASAWTGSGNLYSQVVSIAGVTVHSQVDLTPSVQQLVAFYEKDLTFVTENENGVVTVYAIGQKPTNDYTIQVTITEVNL